MKLLPKERKVSGGFYLAEEDGGELSYCFWQPPAKTYKKEGGRKKPQNLGKVLLWSDIIF